MRPLACLALGAILLSACSKPKPIIVGSKRGPEQTVVAEIVAQHLEKRLGRAMERRLAYGDTVGTYQTLLSGDITLYPEYTGVIVAEILKETPSAEPEVAFQRARSEMARLNSLELLNPLGYDNRSVMMVRAADTSGIDTLSQAAARQQGWRIGVTREFQSAASGLPVLNSYGLPMAAALRTMDDDQLFPALSEGTFTMISVTASDAHLTLPEWKALLDDRGAFPPAQAVLIVRRDAIADEPQLKPALDQLSGRFGLETVRKLAAQVVIDKRPVADVAADFLKQAGL